jgi:L-aminopeptidase/D-esterase-like protein
MLPLIMGSNMAEAHPVAFANVVQAKAQRTKVVHVDPHYSRTSALANLLDPFYEATVQATEEAVINALVANEEMVGIHGHRTPALPRDRVVQLLQEKSVVVDPRRERT